MTLNRLCRISLFAGVTFGISQTAALDADHLQAHLTNFVPKAELHIGFFGVPLAAASQSKPRK